MAAMEQRKSFRLKHWMEVEWSLPGTPFKGLGKIYNLSITGIKLEIDQRLDKPLSQRLSLRVPSIPALPHSAEIMWAKPRGDNKGLLCGARFLEHLTVNGEWKAWMESNILKLAEASDNMILKKYLGHAEEEDY